MKLIYGGRDTGKTRQLLEYAAANRATVITKNARALRVKAQSYGINVDIVEADSLTENTLFDKRVVIHDLDDYLKDYFNKRGSWIMGATMTED